VIVPKVTLGKWRQEIAEWCPSIRCLTFYGGKEDRQAKVAQLLQAQFDVVLTTFEMILRETNELRKLRYEFLVLDEA